jgi:hypothetical protein
MKRLWPILFFVLASLPLATADSTWLYGRIVDVQKNVTTNTKAWVVNTPISEDVTTYTVSVHVADRIISGNYDLTPEEGAPPEEWTANYPVKVQLTGDTMLVHGPTGEVRVHIRRRKSVRQMVPLTAEDKKQLEQAQAPPQSLVGFGSDPKSDAPRPAAVEAAPEPPPVEVGTVNVRSTPYLAEVFVDGDSMGYTPAKINLPPGKHTFRVEKPGYKAWSKEVTITVGSELTLDASLERK